MSEPTGRYRVAWLDVNGQNWGDHHSLAEASAHAARLRRAGMRRVEVLREYESTNRFAADFRRIA